MTKHPLSNSEWRQLRGEIWWAYCLATSGVSAYKFADQYLGGPKAETKLVYKWQNKQNWPSRSTVQKICAAGTGDSKKALPEALWLFDAFGLLKNERCKKNQLKDFFDSCFKAAGKDDEEHRLWSFPDHSTNRTIVSSKSDIDPLVERSDFFGFLAIVALVREAESLHNFDAHLQRCKAMCQSFDAIAKLPWVQPSAALLKKSLDSITGRVLLTKINLLSEAESYDRKDSEPTHKDARFSNALKQLLGAYNAQ